MTKIISSVFLASFVLLATCPPPVVAFTIPRTASSFSSSSTTTALSMAMGPVARAKKLMDPADYNRVIEQKMKKDRLTRTQAEEEYNTFLENPGFYYALDKKEEYYKSLGYKDMFEGMIGEAEKEGRGDEVRERLAKFRQTNQIKAYSVLAVAFLSLCFFYNLYHEDPAGFLPGLPMREL